MRRFGEGETRRALAGVSSWYRLWLGEPPPGDTTLGHESAPSNALNALIDIRTIRQMLDQVELAAVTAARKNGDSWTQIGHALGMTRQSAWEKWREVDFAR